MTAGRKARSTNKALASDKFQAANQSTNQKKPSTEGFFLMPGQTRPTFLKKKKTAFKAPGFKSVHSF
ncbi:hypothetical protein LNP00_05110 [Fructobacillus sp. M158]|uniref:hypothetical protein n=1 Tax=Fructobacillus parabroussonetiae TaxID=2713174 RepID=UPI00200AE6BB|nr:hypothetical protein [Fructobacillus parabroussonetiae]MCK8617744.1 hypothetical protein [Fructobacillus parabroussonetiae]